MSPLISIVIINYNRESYLGAAIESILNQTWQNLELLVWDDGSTDNSVAIAHQYAAKDDRVKVVATPHQGIAASRQQATSQTTGVYLGWVDSDDILAPTALAETADFLNHNSEVGFVYTDYIEIDKNGKLLKYGDRCRIPYSPQRLLVDFMTFHFRLIRRSVYEQVDGVNGSPDYGEDYDLCLKLSEVTQVGRIKKPLYYYRQHTTNVSQVYQKQNLLSCQKIIAQALQRRGLSDKYQIDLDLSTHRFILRRTKVWQNFINNAIQTIQQVTGITQNILQSVSLRRQEAISNPDISLKCVSPKIKKIGWKLTPYLIPLMGIMSADLATAQIVPDGTAGTNVNTNSNTININGGTTSGNNLFHSFQQFGLSESQIANFLSNPNIQNILGRITGGDVSVINGLIQVTGGNSNLYLMNPAGFIFGNDASLNLPAAFTATTANGIGFGENWFNAFGTNDYSTLVGNPTGFAFTMSQQGSIINTGNLAVGTEQSLNLLGGTVANTGTLSAPAGQISVTSVEGGNWVRLSQPGNVLNLEIQSFSGQNQPNNAPSTVSVSSLPELLTVGNTGLTANTDGTVQVAGSNTKLPSTPGTTIVSGNIDVSGNTGGQVNILGENVAVINGNIKAEGNNNGGEILIGGDFQGNGTLPNATNTYVDQSSLISANSINNGNGGRVILWADNSTKFFGNITAKGGANSGDGGFVEVSGKNLLTFNGQVNTSAINGNQGTLLLDPTTLTIIDGLSGDGSFDSSFAGTIAAEDADILPSTISWGALASLGVGANINLQATGNITINPILGNTSGVTTLGVATLDLGNSGSLNLTSTTGAVNFANLSDTITTSGGSISISGNSLNLGNLDTSSTSFENSGNVTLNATNNIIAGNIITTGNGYNAGTIDVTSTNGTIQLGNLDSSFIDNEILGDTNNGGNITLTANGAVNVGNLNSSVTDPSTATSTAGNVNINSTAGSITTNLINSSITDNFGGTFTGTGGSVTSGV